MYSITSMPPTYFYKKKGIGLTIPYSEIRATSSVKLIPPCYGFVSQKIKQYKVCVYKYYLLFCFDYIMLQSNFQYLLPCYLMLFEYV